MIALLLLSASWADAPARIERRLGAMGTDLSVDVGAPDRPTALLASEAAVRAVEAVEARLSTWRADSELSALNAAPVGEWVILSPSLAADLDLAARCHAETDGAFDPAVGALVEAWGLREGGVEPRALTPEMALNLETALARTGLALLERDGSRARRAADIQLDSGGFGKGVALDAALLAARAAGATDAVLDLGGQVAVWGRQIEVQVASPDDRSHGVHTLALAGGSVASSGHSQRPGHLLDPRSGRPAPDFGAITVWSGSAARADCLSTGLYVAGPDAALAWAEADSTTEIVVVAREGQGLSVRTTTGAARVLQEGGK